MADLPDALPLNQRITIGELLAAARMQQIAKFDEILCAVLETGGQISFIKKP